jgi:hypothetical protein
MFIISCPHCNEYIEIIEIACGIFRHGILISDYRQINPHSSKEQCDYLISNNLIYGCGKPFKVELINDVYSVSICDYI